MTDARPEWAHRVTLRQEALGVSSAEVAVELGISRQRYHHLLKCADPRVSSVRRIEEALGLTEGWLAKPLTEEQITRDAARFPKPDWLKIKENLRV